MDTPLPQDLGQNIQNARFPVAVNQPKNAFRQAIQTQGGGGLSQQTMREQQAARLATASAAGTGDVLQAYRAKRATAQAANETMNRGIAQSNEERAFAEQQVNEQIAQYRESKMRQLEQMRQGIREMQAKVADSLDKMGQDFQFGQEQQAIGGAIGTAFGAVQGGIQAHDYYNPNPDVLQTEDILAQYLGTRDAMGFVRSGTGIPGLDTPFDGSQTMPTYQTRLLQDFYPRGGGYPQAAPAPVAPSTPWTMLPSGTGMSPVTQNLSPGEYANARETRAMQEARLRGVPYRSTDPLGAAYARYGRRR